ncbi:transcription initiation factor TFIID subunit 1-like [Chenopodium quinoa]|uniref:transcription initiation factor TFIID subunit 1-like n=1 Tax=Chenopodium quinoa TaxID=63459 RepID=UPI000B783254|nr:transcription initiation factor TFIID subunit 1-like [Chenopodium quinoa]
MSCFYLPKKLKQLPSSTKKAWNSFTSSVSPKLRNLRNINKCSTLPRALTRTATRLFDLHHNKKRRRSIPRSHSSAGRGRDFYYYKEYNNYQHHQPYASGPNSPAATVYIDRLFGESMSSSSMSKQEVIKNDVTRHTTTKDEASASGGSTTVRDSSRGGGGGGSGGKKKKKVKNHTTNNNNSNNNNNWKEYISSMPNIRGVDERAEEFISKFRQDMQIQREQSIIEFQEMLARSA